MTQLEANPLTPDDLADLAAYVEDRLDPEGRARVEARLARDEAFAEVLATAVLAWDDDDDDQVLDAPIASVARPVAAVEPDAETPSTAVHHAPPRQRSRARKASRWRQNLALAASLIMAIALIWLMRPSSGPNTDRTVGLDTLSVVTDPRFEANGVSRLRSVDQGADGFRLGVLWADVQVATAVAARTGDPAGWTAASRAKDVWSAAALHRFETARRALAKGWDEDPAAAVVLAEQLMLVALAEQREAGSDLQSGFDAGHWAESARLWALAGEVDQVRRLWRERGAFRRHAVDRDSAEVVLARLGTELDAGAAASVIAETLHELIRVAS